MKMLTLKEICETALGPIKWHENGDGLCQCPGHKKHTHGTGRADCKIYTSGAVPTVYCFHDHCQEEVADANQRIRDAWRMYVAEPVDEEQVKKAREAAAKKHELVEKMRSRLPLILEQYKIKYEGDHSPTHWFDLYAPGDVIWCGEPYDSGPRFQSCWRPMEMVRQRYESQGLLPRGQFTCPSTFKIGEFNRRNEAVVSAKYLVLEGDQVGLSVPVTTPEDRVRNKANCSAVINWLATAGGMTLRMVVDSGNKSLHGWFNHPGESRLAELKLVLPALGFDRATLKPSQPVRMPGQMRDNGNKQRILFFQ